jgi:hypothetical protein
MSHFGAMTLNDTLNPDTQHNVKSQILGLDLKKASEMKWMREVQCKEIPKHI